MIKRYSFYLLAGVALSGAALIAWWSLVERPSMATPLLVLGVVLLAGTIATVARGIVSVASVDARERPEKLSSREGQELVELLTECVASVKEMEQHDNWARKGYYAFLKAVVTRTHQTISHFQELGVAFTRSEPSDIQLKWQVPSKTTDSMLTLLMGRLAADARYYAVSNVLIWDDLSDFMQAHRDAVRRGVTIRRVFVVDHEADKFLPVSRVADTLFDHEQYSRDWTKMAKGKRNGKYEIKFVTLNDYRNTASRISKMTHFGVFYPGGDRPTVVFDVYEDDLSEFRMISAPKTSPFIVEFEKLWSSAVTLDDPEIRYRIRVHLLRRLSAGSKYLGVAGLDGWDGHKVKEYHAETADVASARNLQVCRLFVFGKGDSTERWIEILKFSHSLEVKSGEAYRWRFCTEAPEELRTGMPYGLYACNDVFECLE